MRDEINNALQVLKNGGVILYPTDTVWGLGCDATNEQAVTKLNAIKNRKQAKSYIILLANQNQLQSYVTQIPEVAYELIEFTENPLTIILSGAKNLAKNVINSDGSVGIRIVKQDFCEQLLQRFRKPITATSANLCGQPTPKNYNEISQKILNEVDYVVNPALENPTSNKPSTIIKLGPSGQFELIRK